MNYTRWAVERMGDCPTPLKFIVAGTLTPILIGNRSALIAYVKG